MKLRRAEVFRLLREGVSPIDIVIEHAVDPHIMVAWFEAYNKLNGSIFLTASDIEQINIAHNLMKELTAGTTMIGGKLSFVDGKLATARDVVGALRAAWNCIRLFDLELKSVLRGAEQDLSPEERGAADELFERIGWPKSSSTKH